MGKLSVSEATGDAVAPPEELQERSPLNSKTVNVVVVAAAKEEEQTPASLGIGDADQDKENVDKEEAKEDVEGEGERAGPRAGFPVDMDISELLQKSVKMKRQINVYAAEPVPLANPWTFWVHK